LALHAELDRYVRSAVPATAVTVTGTSATFTGTLDHHQIEELLHKAMVTRHDLKLVAGVLTLAPRTTSQ
jgi:hypothetical protein